MEEKEDIIKKIRIGGCGMLKGVPYTSTTPIKININNAILTDEMQKELSERIKEEIRRQIGG